MKIEKFIQTESVKHRPHYTFCVSDEEKMVVIEQITKTHNLSYDPDPDSRVYKMLNSWSNVYIQCEILKKKGVSEDYTREQRDDDFKRLEEDIERAIHFAGYLFSAPQLRLMGWGLMNMAAGVWTEYGGARVYERGKISSLSPRFATTFEI